MTERLRIVPVRLGNVRRELRIIVLKERGMNSTGIEFKEKTLTVNGRKDRAIQDKTRRGMTSQSNTTQDNTVQHQEQYKAKTRQDKQFRI